MALLCSSLASGAPQDLLCTEREVAEADLGLPQLADWTFTAHGLLGWQGGQLWAYEEDAAGVWRATHRVIPSPSPGLSNEWGDAFATAGDWLFVGDPGWTNPSNLERGRVTTYRFNPATRIWQAASSFGAPFSGQRRFGDAIAMDGTRAVISAPNPNNGPPPAGPLLITYDLDATGVTWVQGSVLEAPGQSWALSDLDLEDDLLVQTIPSNQTLRVYRAGGGGDWQLEDVASFDLPGFTQGIGVPTLHDGLAHVGVSSYADPLTGSTAGRVLVFGMDITGDWRRLQTLGPQDLPIPAAPARYSDFGVSDGRLVIGQTDTNLIGGLATGRLVMYARNSGPGDPWLPTGALTRSAPGELDTLGLSVGLDGGRLATSYEVYDGETRRIGRVLQLGGIDRNSDGVPDDCQLVGQSYCGPAIPSSTGVAGRLTGLGSALASENRFDLCAVELPVMEFGYLLASSAPGFVPTAGSSIGNLCLAGGPDFGRYAGSAQSSGSAGVACVAIDWTAIPTALGTTHLFAGDTWYFQYWYRDGGLSNFTAGVEVTLE